MSRSESHVGLRQPGRFLAPLESLRGWAILLVLVFHYVGILVDGSAEGLPADSPWWLCVAAAGNTGVTLFFVLSGFLLCLPFLEAGRAGGQVSIGRFYVARLLRILPLYYLVVMLAWLVSGNTTSALKALAFIPVGFQIFPFSVPWWSLSTEMQFYLLLPWVMLALRSRLGRWMCLALLATWFVAHGLYLLEPQRFAAGAPGWLQASLLGRGTAFVVGGTCAWLYLSGWLSAWYSRPKWGALLGGALLVLLLMLLHWYGLVGQKPALRAMPLYHDLEALLWGGLLLCSLRPVGRLGGILLNRLLAHFGTISFSLYLVHVPLQFYLIYPVKMAADGFWSSDAAMLGAVVGSFLLSWGLAVFGYRLVERPFLRAKAHLPVLTERFRARHASV